MLTQYAAKPGNWRGLLHRLDPELLPNVLLLTLQQSCMNTLGQIEELCEDQSVVRP